MLYGWKENSMLTNCLAACAHLTITVSEIKRDIGRKSSIFSYPLAFDAPVREFPLEWRHPVWYGKTRMAWLPHGGRRQVESLWDITNTTLQYATLDISAQSLYVRSYLCFFYLNKVIFAVLDVSSLPLQ